MPKFFLIIAAAALTLTACAGPTMNGMSGMHASSALPTPTATPHVGTRQPDVLTSRNGRLEVTLTAAESTLPYDGGQRWAMTYNGSVNGPTLVVRPGDELTVHLVNHLARPTSLHTHGLHVSPDVDNPFLMIEPGQEHTYTYEIPTTQQAGTYWYHPHVHEITAEQVASGLSGAIIVQNDADSALSTVSTDDVIVLTDPALASSNPWLRTSSGMGGMMGGANGVDMMTAMAGRAGQRLLTNGQDGVSLAAQPGMLQRVHVVNATASTRVVLSYTGASMLQLSASGGRLPEPVLAQTLTLDPGARTELVLVPSASGGSLYGQRLSNEAGDNPIEQPKLIANVPASASTDTSVLPASMSANTRNLFAPDVKVDATRTITLDGHMNPSIDGKLFDPNTVNFTAKKGTVEEWIIKSNSPMAHPIHLHTWPFQIQGERGWTDEVTVEPNQTKVIRVAYDDFGGTTVIHCHILDHEDTGMMAVIKVE